MVVVVVVSFGPAAGFSRHGGLFRLLLPATMMLAMVVMLLMMMMITVMAIMIMMMKMMMVMAFMVVMRKNMMTMIMSFFNGHEIVLNQSASISCPGRGALSRYLIGSGSDSCFYCFDDDDLPLASPPCKRRHLCESYMGMTTEESSSKLPCCRHAMLAHEPCS